MANREVEIVILGGGIIGVSSAYYLARAGKRVLLIDKNGIASGASGANAAFTCAMWRTPGPLLDMGLDCLKEYDQLSEELESDIEFERCGLLSPIENQAKFEKLKPWVESRNKAGLTELRLIDKNELLELEPSAGPSLVGGMFNPQDGHINPYCLVHSLCAKAQSMGVTIYTHTTPVEIKVSNNAVKSVVTDKGEEIKTQYVVNACGIHAPVVGRMVGIEIPITPNKEQLCVTQEIPGNRIIRIPLISSLYKESIKYSRGNSPGKVAFYCNYTKKGNLILGGLNEFVGEDSRTTLEAFEMISTNAITYLPILKEIHLNILRTWANFYIYTPDQIPILGNVDGVDGFIMASGHNDYGIGIGATTGKLVSELICFGETSIPIDEFSLNRFN